MGDKSIFRARSFNGCVLSYVSHSFQEEEIPELEIDIDELLELSDEGQRIRMQVSSCKNQQKKKKMTHCIHCKHSALLLWKTYTKAGAQ